ncbi:hypothetical protein HNQ36_005121 [Afipia massiliensis]|uniref:Uncharacterized protein n=1 Tax=Afipia massiliensis TaxID=211460 RepID=A0A840N7F3_9BRAD|nr:hypothetical protein [Afipia massiliensis]
MRSKRNDTAEWRRRGVPSPTNRTGSMAKRLSSGQPDDWTPVPDQKLGSTLA